MDTFRVNLRPAPKPIADLSKLPPDLARELGSLRDWGREVERAIRAIEEEINDIRSVVAVP